MTRKAALHNLGCKVNAYETEAMQQLLEEAGYEIVPFHEKADVYIINTCSVTNIADRKSRQMLHRAKKQNPEAAVVAAGCYVQSAAEELKADAAVDVLIGNNRKKDLVPILEAYFAGREAGTGDGQEPAQKDPVWVEDLAKPSSYESLRIDHIADHTRAFIKIQDGCNQFCSYCIIPYTRGRVRSRRPEEVEAEVRRLTARGYREVVLTGIHLSSYGLDFADRQGDQPELLKLMKRLDGIEGLERLRLGSLEPRIITESFAKELAGLRTLCPHFHLSLQSGCDAVLKRMNRRYTTAEYEEGCRILRRWFDRPAITTDVIVGFPGETEEEFRQTEAFLQQIHFYEMHVFKYSRREGTRAAAMEGQLPERVKGVRSDRLLELDRKMSLEYRKCFLGDKKEVLFEEKTEIDGVPYLVGHTREYVKAAVPWEESRKGTMGTGVCSRLLTDEILLLSEM